MTSPKCLAAATAAVFIALAVPAFAEDEVDGPSMKFYYPGYGFQWEDQYEMDREWDRQEERSKNAAPPAKEWQDPDKLPRKKGGATLPAPQR